MRRCVRHTTAGSSRKGGAGLTLAEMVIVLAVLAVLGSLVLPAVGRYVGESRDSLTRQSLTRLRDVIAETYWQDSYSKLPRPNLSVSSARQDHPQLRYLFVNPDTESAVVAYDPLYRRGWRGPYIIERPGPTYALNASAGFTARYGEAGDPAILDGWGRPIVVQVPVIPSSTGLLADGCRDVRLVSAGPDGILNTPPDTPTTSLTSSHTGDDVWIAFEVRP